MMRPIVMYLLLAVVLSSAGAQTLSSSGSAAITAKVSSADLIENPVRWDGKEVLFEGEAIHPSLSRGDFVWVNVLDSNAAVGIFLSSDEERSIGSFGSYARRGDTLRVRGVFRRACPDHGGDMDIHAASLEIIAAGKPTPHPVDRIQLALTPAFLGLAAILFIVWRKRKAPATGPR